MKKLPLFRKRLFVAVLLLGLSLTACGGREQEALSAPEVPSEHAGSPASSSSVPENEASASESSSSQDEPQPAQELLIRVQTDSGAAVVFQLNGSTAANSLYRQLPLRTEIEDYAGSEKIFYPPDALDVGDTPLAQGPAGTLAYYEPWGDVALFYQECSDAFGLYALGEAVSGAELISSLTGEVQIERAEEEPSAAST